MLSRLPEDVSSYGPQIDRLFAVIYYVTGATFFIVQITLLVFLFMYRQRPGRRATYTHGNTALEITWTVIPAIVFIGLSFASVSTWGKIKAHPPAPEVTLQVTAKQFNWEVVYPGPDGKLGTEDDFQVDNDIHVPVKKVVHVILKSKDVIHSFFLPNLRLKQDALPGKDILVWFEAVKPGKYELPCAELCGFGHSGMLGHVTVQTPADYQAWVKEQWTS